MPTRRYTDADLEFQRRKSTGKERNHARISIDPLCQRKIKSRNEVF